MEENQLVEEETEQVYCNECQRFLADRFIEGTCPVCGYEKAGGDQCDKCGNLFNATELKNPVCKTGGPSHHVENRRTKHLFLNLPILEKQLRDWVDEVSVKNDWSSNAINITKAWIENGLKPRCITRDLKWGTPVPLKGYEDKVFYVWFDAPIGYISATKDLTPDWEKYWKDEETKMVHFIGKDNIVFHCIVFPAMLKAHGGYILPENVPANEFLNLEGEKISTSRNWAVWLHEYLADFPGKEDVLRYVLCANAPETKDNDFTWTDFQSRNNNELVATLGNFVNRAVVLTHKYFGGVVPSPGEMLPIDTALFDSIRARRAELESNLENFHFREALKCAMDIARDGNKYLQETEPWKVARTDMSRVATILYCALQVCGDINIAFAPFLPFMAEKLSRMLSLDGYRWDDLGSDTIVAAGRELGRPELLFEKIDDDAINAQLRRLETIKKENIIANFKPEPQAPDVDFDTFSKADLRVGTVLECEKVKKADKLLRFLIDDGLEKRTIVSGIAKYYTPEELVGKQVVFIANLPPRQFKGITSQGMILSAMNADGSLAVISPSKPVVPGAQVK